MSTMSAAWAQGRTARASRARKRTSALLMLTAFFGRWLPTWKQARGATLQLAGSGLLIAGVWQMSLAAALILAGLLLIVAEHDWSRR